MGSFLIQSSIHRQQDVSSFGELVADEFVTVLFENETAKGALEEPLDVIPDLERQGLIRHVGLSIVNTVSGRARPPNL